SRNSEVIHAGLYYPKNSLKAVLCVEGRRAIYDYCAEHGVPHKRIGKLLVACRDEEVKSLESVWARAGANGVSDLRWLSAQEASALEPNLTCIKAFLSPSTGIVDSHALMLAYQGDAERAGAVLALRAPVLRGRVESRGFLLEVGGEEPMR